MLRQLLSLARGGRDQQRRCTPSPKVVRRSRCLPRLEELEPRTAPAVTVGVLGGVLYVSGDSAADTITIDNAFGGTLVYRSSGGPSPVSVSSSTFSSIEVYTGAGADTVNVWRMVNLTTITNDDIGTDVVNLGNSALSGVQEIRAGLTVTNLLGIGGITLNINDTGFLGNRNAGQVPFVTSPFLIIYGLAPGGIAYNPNAVGTLNITLGSGADTFNFSSSTSVPTTLNTGPGNDSVIVGRISAPLTVTSSGGLDSVILGNSSNGVQSIAGAVTVVNPPSFTTLGIIDAYPAAVGRTATHSVNTATGIATITGLAPAAISYQRADVNALTITLGSGADTFTFADTDFDPTTLNTGLGNDTVNVQRTLGPLTVTSSDLTSSGQDTVNLGNSSNGVQSILGAVTVLNPGAFTTLNIDDTGDTEGRTIAHSVNFPLATINGLAPAAITYQRADVNNLNINLGSGNDTFTFADTDFDPTTLNTGPGNDTVNVQRTSGPLTVNGGLGNDAVGVATPTSSLGLIQGPLTLNGEDGTNSVAFNDQTAPTAMDYFLQPTTLDRTGLATITCDAFTNVALFAGNFGDNIAVIAAPGTNTMVNAGGGDDNFFVGLNPVAYNGDAGFDILWAPDGPNFWSITGLDSGDFNGIAPFTSVESHIGNLSDDYFALSDGAGLSGFIWDQGGNALLDYSAYSTGVYVNLPTYQASNIFGGVYGIPYVLGGAGDDILVGDDFGNYLDGGPGRDLVIGGGASYYGYADYLVGGPGEDIVIGGFTAYDYDSGALFAILAEWTQPTDYYERVVNLYYGLGVPALNEGTVFYNYSYGNVLLGDTDLDLFFGDPSYDFSDGDPEAEYFVPVF